MTRVPRGAFLVTLVMACASPSVDHERLGDQAYREGDYQRALAEYQAASGQGRARLWAKLGSAALQLGEHAAATDAYLRLAQQDASRTDEAAIGLSRVARAAAREGAAEGPAVSRAITALRTVAPSRPLGRLALAPAWAGGLDRQEALSILPVALATADAGRSVDSLLVRYGMALRETLACDAAAETYRTVLRRSRLASLTSQARTGLAECALLLGLDALLSERLDEAERWFDEAASTDFTGPVGWRARIGYGDARGRQGDYLGAATAYQSVLSGQAVPDSLLGLARERLNAIAGSDPVADTIPPMRS
ncbi:MAG TPA: tetratricopeptide repeat protein [Gemmatimonadales bacterium]|nr:tetratricopeptide repeat protein [Gemmatimonadales bacterium]